MRAQLELVEKEASRLSDTNRCLEEEKSILESVTARQRESIDNEKRQEQKISEVCTLQITNHPQGV